MGISRYVRDRLVTILLSGLLIGAAFTANPLAGAAVASASNPLQYVALGDSYTSGPLDGPATGNLLCLQSSASYPYYVASHLGADLSDVSCSGATSADLTTASQYSGVPPQVDALSPSTQLVTLTDGGNDNNLFVSALEDCGTIDIFDVLDIGTPCEDEYGATFANSIAADAPTLEATFATIRRDAPSAKVYVVGYPDILPSKGGCYPTMPLTNGDTAYLNNLEVDLNATIKKEAVSAGVRFVSTYSQFVGHGSCATGSNQWINAIVPTDGGISVHPNATGEQKMAAILQSAIAVGGIG